ncbi:MAG: hypothetical protein R3C44_20100 [Chloroflexota bacterium]
MIDIDKTAQDAEERCPQCDTVVPPDADKCVMCGMPRSAMAFAKTIVEEECIHPLAGT